MGLTGKNQPEFVEKLEISRFYIARQIAGFSMSGGSEGKDHNQSVSGAEVLVFVERLWTDYCLFIHW